MSASAASTPWSALPRTPPPTAMPSCSSWVPLRIHSPWPAGATDGPQHPTAAVDENLPWMRVRAPDIQAAMGTLSRLPPSREEPAISLSRVDLRSVALHDSRLNGSRFRYANLARSVLSGAWLEHADLTAADLRRANLDHATLDAAQLTGAQADQATIWPDGFDPDQRHQRGIIENRT